MLKKPSEYFKKEKLSVDNSIQELVKTPELNTFSDAFESFKNNLSKIEVLSEFSETLDNYRVNIERVNHLSDKVEDIQTEIQSLLKKEDLDRVMMSQLLVVEQSIRDVQSKVKSINEKNLVEIRLDVAGLTETVNEFLENDVPKYKKLVVDAELRTNNRYEELENNVNSTLEGIGEFVDKKYDELTETLQGINAESLAGIIEDFKILDEAILKLKEEEIPKYKGFIVETERKTESKLNEFDEKLNETLLEFDERVDEKIDNVQSSIQEIDDKFIELTEKEIPKYKGFIVETERKTESKLNEFDKRVDETVNSVLEKLNLIEGDKTDLVDAVNKRIKEIKNIRDYVIEDLKNGEQFKKEINQKVTDLEIEIVRNESHIRKQNKSLEQIQEDVLSTIQKINLDEIEEKNYELGKKIKYLEEIFDKFNQEKLTEGLLNQPPEVKNSDPITPLDQNFVTLQQLQEHYRLFINRIQQQLATIGGGGETRLEFLDDVDRNSVKQNGYVLQYNSSVGKFIGTSYVPGSGGTGEISIQKDGSVVGTAVTILNFSGAGISTITAVAGIATITIPSSAGGTVRTVTSYTATEGQTTFSATYTVGYVDVFLNGVKLSQSQYIASNGTSVFLTEGASADDVVEIVAFSGFNITANTISGVVVRDEGTIVGSSVTSFNFVGTGVSATVVGNDATITITGGGGGESYWVSTTAGIHTLSNTGIGTTNPTSKLTVSGDGFFTGIVTATDYNSASDINLKENITIINNPLDKIVKLEGVNFNWKETGRKSLGVIAQEVEKVLPELVSGEESKTVNYNGLVGLLIECVKQQQKEIDELKKLIDK